MSNHQGKNRTPDTSSRILQLKQLDKLHEVLWPLAMGGDAGAMNKVLDIMDKGSVEVIRDPSTLDHGS